MESAQRAHALTVTNFSSKKRLFHTFRKNKWLLIMCMPAMLLILAFSYLPMFGMIIAFKNYRANKGFWGSEWVGFDNFKFLFATKDAWTVTFNTVFLNALFIVFGLIASVAIAIMLNEIRKKAFLKFYQSALFFPYFLSWVIVSYFVFALLSGDNGLVNKVLGNLGLTEPSWYSTPHFWPIILTLVYLWKNVGYLSIIYVAGLIGINEEYYEAAKIDGATRLQQIFKITLPLLTPLIITMTLLQIGRIFYADFGLFYNVTLNSGMLYQTTDVLDTYVFRSLRVLGDVGMASAAGMYQAVVGFILVMLSNWSVRKIDKDSALF